MVRQTNSDEQLKLLLKGLVWNYKSYDMSYLIDLDVLSVLSYGDGGRLHPIAANWGKNMHGFSGNLAATIANVFEFFFK